ncbi:Na(+)/H(+) exchange regulatory cofactor NHE-RF1 [Schistocerca piceifrons]|uniref:Na(+)/H(+) exchange regulatory cofactor NHE-RF1 n=1 Tax=Schistocerca piceifrons TaxID=274613 RepID=UPI001F5FCB5C|nr:Na(+)/H(+) exchange regulatory cofactor NHE-RF1 [Schistocerca piceifrons]XP_047107275.1 Na(+)/H(+) exchange regulatory cofactor NHE-RF1 [Schistocerca piceifrons]XP_049776038.1 Na(+)/H(+) exchange regulatory cofactor NHE-RF1 [Schistocerca cancellata]XP_049800413.1 Na(+)/H(+) exchange regulatory cofactor NHE-RF1-like [Schistocerca nitens]XP_049951680.1 Na(+)/H(+) exchange regulatory cofactor NHE-RF1 [Schistocerca serialis cubense]XP_049951681.1 Na(+)/H(+) exchange regulatory cofactor NHE-RF1 
MSNGALSSDTPVARLCHIIQWKHFDGYGFNLHAEKGKPGQYIGKVDEGSPAEAAGLKEGDRIIEVNGVNIANENHKQVVQRIKAIPNETKLLVVDAEADKYYKANNITIKSGSPDVKYLKTPMPDADNSDDTDEKKSGNNEDGQIDAVANDKKSSDAGSSNTTPSTDRKSSSSHVSEHGNDSNTVQEVNSKSPGAGSNNSTLERSSANSGINLNMSAKELREKLASRKKYDPKKESMDFKKKFEIVQTL